MHVVSSISSDLAGPEARSLSLAQSNAALLERKLTISGKLQGLRLHVIVSPGDVWGEVRKVIERERVDMVLVGTHSRTGIAKLMLGSIAEKIFRHATCPVLTLATHAPIDAGSVVPGQVGPLLFPTDFSDASLTALPYAISFADELKTKLVLLHFLPFIPHAGANRWHTVDDVVLIRKQAQFAARERLTQLVTNCSLETEALCIAEPAQPVSEGILFTAKTLKAYGIIMGLHHKTHIEIASHFPWSTAYEVVCGAECPVLTSENSLASARPPEPTENNILTQTVR